MWRRLPISVYSALLLFGTVPCLFLASSAHAQPLTTSAEGSTLWDSDFDATAELPPEMVLSNPDWFLTPNDLNMIEIQQGAADLIADADAAALCGEGPGKECCMASPELAVAQKELLQKKAEEADAEVKTKTAALVAAQKAREDWLNTPMEGDKVDPRKAVRLWHEAVLALEAKKAERNAGDLTITAQQLQALQAAAEKLKIAANPFIKEYKTFTQAITQAQTDLARAKKAADAAKKAVDNYVPPPVKPGGTCEPEVVVVEPTIAAEAPTPSNPTPVITTTLEDLSTVTAKSVASSIEFAPSQSWTPTKIVHEPISPTDPVALNLVELPNATGSIAVSSDPFGTPLFLAPSPFEALFTGNLLAIDKAASQLLPTQAVAVPELIECNAGTFPRAEDPLTSEQQAVADAKEKLDAQKKALATAEAELKKFFASPQGKLLAAKLATEQLFKDGEVLAKDKKITAQQLGNRQKAMVTAAAAYQKGFTAESSAAHALLHADVEKQQKLLNAAQATYDAAVKALPPGVKPPPEPKGKGRCESTETVSSSNFGELAHTTTVYSW